MNIQSFIFSLPTTSENDQNSGIPLLLLAILAYALYRLIRWWRKRKYFTSDEFITQKENIKKLVNEHNEIANYVNEIDKTGSYKLGQSKSSDDADLAKFENISKHNYRRDRNKANYRENVHNCSLQIVRNASREPIKYFVKYFCDSDNEETLAEVEKLSEKLSRIENALKNLSEREKEIIASVNPPKFITKHYGKEFAQQVGYDLPNIKIPYEEYFFEYVSAGGNSGQKTSMKLNSQFLDSLMEYLNNRIRYQKTVARQRALMTTKFREYIKNRDSYTCRNCNISVSEEPHLLLEVDHIIPVSKGGLSVEENLQTLCWKCNRTKSNKTL